MYLFCININGGHWLIMQTKVQKWGNSLALRIPKSFARDAHIENDSVVEVRLDGGKIIVEPMITRKWTLEELLAGINPENIHQETDAGSFLGQEVW